MKNYDTYKGFWFKQPEKTIKNMFQTIEDMINLYVPLKGSVPSEIRINPVVNKTLQTEYRKECAEVAKSPDEWMEREKWFSKGSVNYFVYEGEKIPFSEDENETFISLR